VSDCEGLNEIKKGRDSSFARGFFSPTFPREFPGDEDMSRDTKRHYTLFQLFLHLKF